MKEETRLKKNIKRLKTSKTSFKLKSLRTSSMLCTEMLLDSELELKDLMN